MSYLLLHKGLTATLLTDDPVVPAAELPRLREALDLLEQAERQLDTAMSEAAAMSEEARAEGLAEGRRRGEDEAAAQVSARLFDLEVESARRREVQREEAAKLAVEIVRRIAESLGPDATVTALAETAARELAPDTPATVRVAPAARDSVTARLSHFEQLTIVGDPLLDDTECVLETSAGVIRAGLETQLDAIERAWTRNAANA